MPLIVYGGRGGRRRRVMFKKIVSFFFRCLVPIAYWSYGIEGVNALLLILPAKRIVPTLRRFGAAIGENAIIHSPLIIHNAGEDYRNLTIGSHCYVGREVFFDLKDKVTLGDRVTLSMRVTLITHTEVGASRLSKTVTASHAPIHIDSDAYLGANATVLEGVHVGEASLIGAASVVLKDVPPRVLVAGNPAKEIKSLHD